MASIVVAIDSDNGIGYENRLPWPSHLEDIKRFQEITTITEDPNKINAVIMGRKTWDSIPEKFRPLKNRHNVIITSKKLKNLDCYDNLDYSIKVLEKMKNIENIFIIGGQQVYSEALRHPKVEKIYLTVIKGKYNSDRHFYVPSNFTLDLSSVKNVNNLTFLEYNRQHEELQYLNLIKKVIDIGSSKKDRTGTGTKSLFGEKMVFDLKYQFPLLTTKRVFWKGVVLELLWFLQGKTDSKILSKNGVKIWDKNGTLEFMKTLGITRNEGDLGPVYGFQWRHFGAEYIDCYTDYTGKGIDQVKYILDELKNNPDSRRLIINSWNCSDLSKMALPPCHTMCQFYVSNGELSCQLYQRSADLGLGVPFNIASYALLTYIFAKQLDLIPGQFIHILGDTHVYNNHIEPLKEQLLRSPRNFPTLTFDKRYLEDYSFEDFIITGYNPDKPIKMDMAV